VAKFDLSAMARRTRSVRRSAVVIRDIVPPATLATDLYRACYLPIVQAWQNATPTIVAEYDRTLGAMTTDSSADVEAQLSFVQQELNRLVLVLTPRLRSWALRVEAWQRGKWRGAVLSATGVDLQTLIGPEDVRDTLDSVIAWNTNLIRDVGEQARQRISNAVFSGLNQRKPAREVAKEIREATGMARDRSLRVASDQLNKLSGSLADERRREAGIDLWKWRHSGKRHPRADHVARDGKIYADTEAGAGANVEGQAVSAPPADRPSQLPYCGCRGLAVLVFD
jgi:hypothetical protein